MKFLDILIYIIYIMGGGILIECFVCNIKENQKESELECINIDFSIYKFEYFIRYNEVMRGLENFNRYIVVNINGSRCIVQLDIKVFLLMIRFFEMVNNFRKNLIKYNFFRFILQSYFQEIQ